MNFNGKNFKIHQGLAVRFCWGFDLGFVCLHVSPLGATGCVFVLMTETHPD